MIRASVHMSTWLYWASAQRVLFRQEEIFDGFYMCVRNLHEYLRAKYNFADMFAIKKFLPAEKNNIHDGKESEWLRWLRARQDVVAWRMGEATTTSCNFHKLNQTFSFACASYLLEKTDIYIHSFTHALTHRVPVSQSHLECQ